MPSVPGRRPRRRAPGAAVLAALAVVVAVLPASAPAQAADDAGPWLDAGSLRPANGAAGPLSPALAAVRATGELRSNAFAPATAQQDPAGRVLVQVRVTDLTPATLAAVGAYGEVLVVAAPMRRVTMRVSPAALDGLAGLPQVQYADLVPAPLTAGPGLVGRAPGASAPLTRAGGPCTGSVVSEADQQLQAAAARAAVGVDGATVPIGVLSDSFDKATGTATRASDDVRRGDLPGPANPCGYRTAVRVVQETPDPSNASDEGRAMLQLIHDLAPGAPLLFASASGGEDVMARNIRALAKAGAKVIVDDISYLAEPFFQQGVVDQAIAEVTAAGVTYLSAAGNSNVVLGGRDVGSWETPRTRLTRCTTSGGRCVDFDPRGRGDWNNAFTVAPGGAVQVVAQWAQPLGKVTTDFDLVLVDAASNRAIGQTSSDSRRSQQPVDAFGWRNDGFAARKLKLVVLHNGGKAMPRLKVQFVRAAGVTKIEYSRSAGGNVVGPTIFGHNGGPATLSVGAVPYDNRNRVEPFSSRGPVTHYFAPARADGSPRLAAPQVTRAPQLAATDGTATSFFAEKQAGVWRFYGTSAAAPHAAAVAALLLQAQPDLTPREVREQLTATAARVGSAHPAAVGAGLADALAALTAPGPAHITRTLAGRGSATVQFTAPARVGVPALSSYGARCTSPHGATRQVDRAGDATTALRVTRLTTGVPYRCVVLTSNGKRTTASAPGALIVPTGTPGRPGKPAVSPVRRAIKVTVRGATNTGGLPATYRATCAPVGGGKTRARTGRATVLKVTRLSPSAVYRCSVQVRNALGTGPASPRSVKVRPRR